MQRIFRSVRGFIGLILSAIVGALAPVVNSRWTVLDAPPPRPRQAIVQRKIRGWAQSLFQNVESSFGSDSLIGAMAHAGAIAFIGLLLASALLLSVGAGSPLHAAGTGEHVPHLLFAGSLASQVKEKNDQIAVKQDALAKVFDAAGADADFNKPEVLTLVGAKSSLEAVEKVRAMNNELSDLGKSRDSLAELERIETGVREAKNRPANAPPVPGDRKERQEERFLSMGEMITESEAWKEASGAKGSKSEFRGEVKGRALPALKTVMSTGAGWAPETTRTGLVVPIATRPIQVIDVIPAGTTKQAAVVFMEETTMTNNAAERAEAGAYAESAFALTERSQTVRSIGHSLPITDEQLEDVQEAQSYIDQRMVFGVRQRLDSQIINGDGNAPNLAGLLNVAGIQTQAKGADPVLDAFYKAHVKVRVTGRAFPSVNFIHPTDWQGVMLLRTADGIYIWGHPSAVGPTRMWGVLNVETDAIAQGTGLTGDVLNFVQLVERRGMEVVVGYNNDDLTKGKRTVRAGVRVALCTYRAAAICKVTGL